MLKHFVRPILLGLVIGALTLLAVLIALAFLAVQVDLPPSLVVPLATIANALGAFAGGFTAARSNGRNGWFIGLVAALVLFLLSTVSGFALYSQIDGSFLIIKAMIMLACGMVGGMLAVNFCKRKKRR